MPEENNPDANQEEEREAEVVEEPLADELDRTFDQILEREEGTSETEYQELPPPTSETPAEQVPWSSSSYYTRDSNNSYC